MPNSTLEASYNLIQKLGNNVEIREYPAQIWATARGIKQAEAFNILSGFVFGKNERQEKIGMTFPIIAFNSIEGRNLAFIMPSQYRLRTLPKPYRDEVKLELVAPKKMASITFSGSLTPDSFDTNFRLLQEILKNNKIAWIEPPYLFQYNEPWTPPFMRKNECVVQIIS
jgi:SOUL heme-binding protein